MLVSSTEARLARPGLDNPALDHEPDHDVQFPDAGVSSVGEIAFFKLVDDEFKLGLLVERCPRFRTPGHLSNSSARVGPGGLRRFGAPSPGRSGAAGTAASHPAPEVG